MTQPVIFISYSQQDETEKDRLLSHLGVLQSAGLIYTWCDDQIKAGADWSQEIGEAIDQAEVAILLITANFLNSSSILNQELPALLKRRQHQGLTIIPVIARPCAWRNISWLSEMSIRPRNGRPVWSDAGSHVDEDLTIIAEEVAAIVVKSTPHITPSDVSSESESTISGGVHGKSQRTSKAEPTKEKTVSDEPKEQSSIGRVNISNISRNSSVSFGNFSSDIKAGGDITFGDKITTTTTYGASASPTDPNSPQVKLEAALDQWRWEMKVIIAKLDDEDEKEFIEKTANKMVEEAKKGETADPTKVESFLEKMSNMAPDILEVTVRTLQNPFARVGLMLQKIDDRIKLERQIQK
jgi:hypothetical protein